MQAKTEYSEIKKLINSEQYHSAISNLEDLLSEKPDDAEALYLLSRAQHSIGNSGLALENMSRSLSIEPNSADGNVLMAKIHFSLKHIEQALSFCDDALELDDYNLDALSLRGYLLAIYFNNPDEAISSLEKALARKPSLHHAHAHLALALSVAGRAEEAIKHALKAIKLEPKEAGYYQNAGDLYLQLGNKKEAARLLTKACSLNPDLGQAYYNLSRSKHFTQQDRPLIKKMENTLEHPMSVPSRQCIHFALGKAFNDLEEPDNAFSHYDQGNRLVHRKYDEKQYNNISKYIRQKLKHPTPLNSHTTDTNNPVPIFIIGMPRSGSTLIDQTLASHPQVHSIGESLTLGLLVSELCKQKGQTSPFGIHLIDNRELKTLSHNYLTSISQGVSSNITHIVNKQLENYFILGLIASTFPNAKIIHAQRHPLDTCISCYFQNFDNITDVAWSFKLENIGHYYNKYHEIMEHWHKVLPIPILDIQYEMMVSDFEGSARKIVEFCELGWDPQVLDFHSQKRTVKTASLMQVREPIYNRSVARWKKYSRYISPLVDILGPILESERSELEAAGLKLKSRQRFSLKRLWN
jgi:tetratricopeptide (TPR) repeat protein